MFEYAVDHSRIDLGFGSSLTLGSRGARDVGRRRLCGRNVGAVVKQAVVDIVAET